MWDNDFLSIARVYPRARLDRGAPALRRAVETALNNFDDMIIDLKDTQHTAAERSAAVSRSTWVSITVNVTLSGL